MRRVATDLGVTPMALYRHVKDKQDLINAMYEAVVDGFDIKAGITPSMKWTSQLRRSLMNVIALHQRPVALPLAIAYTCDGSPSIWRAYDDSLDILLKAGFARRDAGAEPTGHFAGGGVFHALSPDPPLEADQLLLARKQFELVLLSLPRTGYPNLVASARELVDAQFSQPQDLVKQIVDLMVAGVEATYSTRWRKLPRGSPSACRRSRTCLDTRVPSGDAVAVFNGSSSR